MGRNENIAIFKDTKEFCGSNDRGLHQLETLGVEPLSYLKDWRLHFILLV